MINAPGDMLHQSRRRRHLLLHKFYERSIIKSPVESIGVDIPKIIELYGDLKLIAHFSFLREHAMTGAHAEPVYFH